MSTPTYVIYVVVFGGMNIQLFTSCFVVQGNQGFDLYHYTIIQFFNILMNTSSLLHLNMQLYIERYILYMYYMYIYLCICTYMLYRLESFSIRFLPDGCTSRSCRTPQEDLLSQWMRKELPVEPLDEGGDLGVFDC